MNRAAREATEREVARQRKSNSIAARRRLILFCNSLAMKKTITARREAGRCALCNCVIGEGDEYRNGGPKRKAHESCWKATADSFKEKA